MSINVGNIYSSESLSKYMYESLPVEAKPQLKNPYDAVALLSHACMLVVGFRLVGLGEDHKIEAASKLSDIEPLPQEWNATSSDNYSFRYAHDQSSLKFLVKVSRLGGKAVVNGMGLGDDKVHTTDFPIKEFLSESGFPYTAPSSDNKDENAHTVEDLFLSSSRITDLGSFLKVRIIQKLAPGLYKKGYEESTPAANPTEQGDSRQQPHSQRDRDDPRADALRDDRSPPHAQPRPFDDPLPAAPRRPLPAGDFPPPGFEDEYEINRPPGRIGPGGERRPLNIGERDLYPQGLGPHDPLAGGGFRFGGGFGGGGGMQPTLDDPLFGGGGGTGAYDPRSPPGARYDPIGPGDGPPNLRGGPRFPGGGGGFGGGRPPNPYGGFGGGDFI